MSEPRAFGAFSPEVSIGEDAIGYVEKVEFDSERYLHYLRTREVSDDRISRLDLVVTDVGSVATSVASYQPAFLSEYNRHTIRFSPKHMPRDVAKQGAILRHETEHFIREGRLMGKIHRAARFAAGLSFIGVSAYVGGRYGYEIASNQAHNLSGIRRMGEDGLGGALGGVAAGYLGSQIFGNILTHLDPEELLTRLAVKKYKEALPDGTLKISLKPE